MAEFVVEFGKDGKPLEPDGRLDAAAFHRNHGPIWSMLGPRLAGKAGNILEIGSGTGQHAAAFARETPEIDWWPSDYNEKHLASIAAWRSHARLANLRSPLRLDVSSTDWELDRHGVNGPSSFLAIVCCNVLHISPWRATEGLLGGAARHLAADGRLFVYGPFMRGGQHTAPSNAAFDASLRDANHEWGVRDTVAIEQLAAQKNLRLSEVVEMPANNLILMFDRSNAD
jgi:SAM-dependent methyltransferase